MELVPEGPEADAARARLRDIMSSRRAEVDRRRPVYGLGRPDLSPRLLGASDITSVTLHAGELLSAEGPMISVRTAWPHPQGLHDWGVLDQLADEHARLAEHTGFEDPFDEAAPAAPDRLFVGEDVVDAQVYRENLLWGAQAMVSLDAGTPVIVTVVSRGVALDEVRLALVDDLEPYWQGRETQIAMLAARHKVVRPQDLDLPPTQGLDAHRALVAFCLQESEAMRARLQAGQRPRSVPGRATERARMWEMAVRAQMHLADQDRRDANRQVTSIVNQLLFLSTHSSWFGDQALRAAAVEEVLGFQVFGADVASRSAQQAWLQARSGRRGRPPIGPAPLPPDIRAELRQRALDDLALERQAQAAWDTWASTIR
ncbi:MAG TPA: hypothetical protein VFR07_02705 [Mycobacteriales bacterium]|nr:hypothetical protein [Mycobacteriales bacterium]